VRDVVDIEGDAGWDLGDTEDDELDAGFIDADASQDPETEDVAVDLSEPTDGPVIFATSDETTIRGAMTLPHASNVDGIGSIRIGEIAVQDSVGYLSRGGEIPALVYIVQDWSEFSYTLHHVLAPTNDELNVLYFYCGNASATSFDYIWHESYDTAMDWETASGSCSAQMERVRAEVTLSRLNHLPEPSQLVSGFSVTGDDLVIDDTGGTLALDGRSFDVYPFETVDCTTDCSADPADGWWELHSILEDTADGDTCFVIFYLMVSAGDSVVLSHGFCMDSLTPLDGVLMDATWTAPASRKGRGISPPGGPRHPVLGYVLRPRPEW